MRLFFLNPRRVAATFFLSCVLDIKVTRNKECLKAKELGRTHALRAVRIYICIRVARCGKKCTILTGLRILVRKLAFLGAISKQQQRA